jgi:hypothetical protein
MTERFVVVGRWGLRVDESCDDLELVPAIGSVVGAAGLCHDLRGWGIQNVHPETMPMAIVAGDAGGLLSIESLAMRLDAHQIHFWTPPDMPLSVPREALARTLRGLFQAHHLALNNFECNHHPLPARSKAAAFWFLEPDLSPTVVAGELLAWIDDRKVPDLMLQPGNEAFRIAGPIHCMATLDRSAILTVQRGGRRKKPAWDSPLWHVERFAMQSGGVWTSDWTIETAASELRPFDATSPLVAATLSPGPLISLASFETVLQRVCIESLQTGALIQADAALYRRVDAHLTERSRLIFSLRLVSSRYPHHSERLWTDLYRIADYIEQRFEPLQSNPPRRDGEPLPALLSAMKRDLRAGC